MLDKVIINRKYLKELDFGIIITIILIVTFSSINIYSATHNTPAYQLNYIKQIVWLCVGLFVAYLILIVDYSVIKGYSSIIYWFGIFLLVLNKIPMLQSTVNGASSWIKIGSFSMQPSEFAKLGMIIMLAKQLSDMEGNINNIKNLSILCIYAAIPMVLIVSQPDMGMTMVSFFIVLGMFFIAGLDLKIIGGGILGLIGAVVIVWNSALMEEYWKTRLISFINPEAYALGAGMQTIESLKGIGSGGFFGKGFLNGTQVAGGFIPEDHTDFIFSVVGEEWGLIGALVLLFLYGIIIYRMIRISKNSKDLFGSIVCVGIISGLMFGILQNIGMTIGLMPVTGITLPFMSYGGSSMITSFIGLGLILNIGMRRKKINF